MPVLEESPSEANLNVSNGHSRPIPDHNPKPKRVAPQAWLAYAFKPGDPRQKEIAAKALAANRAKRAQHKLELEIGDNPTRILSEQVKDTRLAISRCKTAESRALLTKTLLDLVQALAKLQAQARETAPAAKPKKGPIEPIPTAEPARPA